MICKTKAPPVEIGQEVLLSILKPLIIQMISVICILAGVPPCNMHFSGSKIDHHGRDGILPVKRINACDIMVTDRVRQIDMILLDRLQGLDRMRRVLSQQAIGTEIAYA